MKNFVAFKFKDNDFHSPLREAIDHVTSRMTEELTLPNYHKFVALATNAFHSIRRIDNSIYHTIHDSSEYISGRLEVSEVDRLGELGASFEGYVYDRNTLDVYYYDGDY